MTTEDNERLTIARGLMDDFARRTGLTGEGGDPSQRYLWTDAFAVQTFFALSYALADTSYYKMALKLIDEVHHHLGRFHALDERKGWISGLPDEQGEAHPTAGGLRIGKSLPERGVNAPFNERLEWQRDGQYYHYLTRWLQALLEAARETGERRYALWAAEGLQSGGKFIYTTGSYTRMYWKMSIDLTRPLVASMGAHDPLDGLVVAYSILEQVPEQAETLLPIIEQLKNCARDLDWATTDPLGIGGLLLNLARVVQMDTEKIDLPRNIKPQKLLDDSLHGLAAYKRMQQYRLPAEHRLPFRDCGLSLGLRVSTAGKEGITHSGMPLERLQPYVSLADEIETFWCRAQAQQSSTWTDHLDINAVTLAASLVAGNKIEVDG